MKLHHHFRHPFTSTVGGLLLVLIAVTSPASFADCPGDPEPPTCDIDGQFIGGRWDLSQLSGSYTLAGDEVFYPFLFDPKLWDDYHTEGTLTLQTLGGSEENYIDVACDGTITGVGHDRIFGSITKIADVWYYDPDYCVGPPFDMNWVAVFERSYTITGNVTGVGQLELDFDVHTATADLNGTFATSYDCIFIGDETSFTNFNVSGDIEQVRLEGGYDPVNFIFQPTVSPRGAKTWVDDVSHRLALNATEDSNIITLHPSFQPPGSSQPWPQRHNKYFLQDAVTVVDDVQVVAEPNTPLISSLELQEPSWYLFDVDVDTVVIATIDWRGNPPGEVEFTYGSTVETVAGADVVPWTFNAGEPGATIQAIAKNGAEESLPYVINTPKVAVPGWAGTASDWSGVSGVRYDAVLDWPISLETTRTLDTISLFSGLWGISGSASSQFNATAFSTGAAGAGDMTTDANFEFAGRQANFHMEGPNQTTLACDELTTTGSATAQAPPAKWQKTINPLTLIPGLQTAACSLSGLLCDVINSIGIKATADATLSGTGTYTGDGSQIVWDGGSVGGDINGRISAGGTLPPPLSSVAGFTVYGGASGCIDIQVAPSFDLTTLGGQLDAGAIATFFGMSAQATEEWPFGDACAKSTKSQTSGAGWVSADGQLAMAVTDVSGDIVGIAVWSELPAGQVRPSGDIHYRFFENGAWRTTQVLTTDADADTAPAVELDENGNALIVYQRSTAPLPSSVGDLPAFANGYELQWASISRDTTLPIAEGALTTNSANDFGPRLRRDHTGGLHLFWQRANGVEITGTNADPVSIHTRSWHALTSSWGAESTAASGLENTFGWSAAAHSEDEMLIGLIIDTNGDFANADDRELFQITRSGATWQLPLQVTSNLVADDSPLAAFDSAGSPVLLWRNAAEVLELRGDLFAAPTAAFTSADPLLDDGIGIEFAQSVVATAQNGLVVAWPEGVTLQLTRDLDGTWVTPLTPFSGDDAQTAYALKVVGSDQLVAYANQAFEAGNSSLSPFLEPRFQRLIVHGVFADDFESGNLSRWSAAVP